MVLGGVPAACSARIAATVSGSFDVVPLRTSSWAVGFHRTSSAESFGSAGESVTGTNGRLAIVDTATGRFGVVAGRGVWLPSSIAPLLAAGRAAGRGGFRAASALGGGVRGWPA